MYGIRFGGKPLSLLQGETAFFGGVFCLEYLSRRSEKGNVYFANCIFSFCKLKILTLIEKDHLGDWSPEKDCCL